MEYVEGYVSNRCPICNEPVTTARCKCKLKEQVVSKPNRGWTCPKCGSVYSPYMSECLRCNGQMK